MHQRVWGFQRGAGTGRSRIFSCHSARGLTKGNDGGDHVRWAGGGVGGAMMKERGVVRQDA